MTKPKPRHIVCTLCDDGPCKYSKISESGQKVQARPDAVGKNACLVPKETR